MAVPNVGFRCPSKFMTHLKSLSCDCSCFSATHITGENILVGCRKGLKFFNFDQGSVANCKTSLKMVVSVIEHHNTIYILHKDRNYFKVKMYTPELKFIERLFKFFTRLPEGPVMAVSDKYIVVSWHLGPFKLCLYNRTSKVTRTIEVDRLQKPYFLPDGRLLFEEGDFLAKYSIDNEKLNEVWRCDVSMSICAFWADGDGMIYILSYDRTTFAHIVSPNGKVRID